MADKLLKSIKFPTLPDRYVIGDHTLTEEGAAADAKAVGEALATKADTKGRYEDLIVGGAEQLMSDEYETDKEPYLFRTTGGSADVWNREYLDSIVGGTVAWNQLVSVRTSPYTKNGVTSTYDADGTVTLSGTITNTYAETYNSVAVVPNHIYIYNAVIVANPNNVSLIVRPLNMGSATRRVAKASASQTYTNYGVGDVVNGTDMTGIKFKAYLIDLTAMFGTTIADYIYSIEQSQAGAGVAWFRNYFPEDYYPYDPGTLRSVEGVSAHETVGFNQFDEDTVLDSLGFTEQSDGSWYKSSIADLNGALLWENKADYSGNICVTYDYKYANGAGGSGIRFKYIYEDGSAYTDYPTLQTSFTNRVFSSAAGSYHGKVVAIGFDYGTSVNSTWLKNVCVNYSWDGERNGEYEPYQKHTYPLDSSLTLRGVPKLADGKLAYDGDIYPPSGEVQRRYGIVDLGTLTWTYDSSVPRFYSLDLRDTIKKPQSATFPNRANVICSKYVTVPYDGQQSLYGGVDKSCAVGTTGSLNMRDSAYTDAASFKTAMSGVYFVYELATPTTETAEGYEHYQICDPSGTEEFVTTGIVPVGHETRYPHDLKKKIETAPDSPSTDGTYLMKRSGGKNTYMALPSTPSANGSYVLTVTVSGGSASYSWAAKE